MDSIEYINLLKDNMKSYFDIFEDYTINTKELDIYGRSIVRNESYIGNKKFVLDAYENYEHCLIKSTQKEVDKDEIEKFTEFLKSSMNILVTPCKEHMSTIISGVYISDLGFSEEAIHIAKKFKHSKTFSMGLKGWCDEKLILIDLKKNKVYTNREGKKNKKFYESILKISNNS